VIDTPGLSSAVGPAMQQLRDQTKATTAAIADEWRQTAAKIRASIAQGALSQADITRSQRELIGVLDTQITRLRQRNELTNKELSTLKAVTLERERQADALKRGVGVGVTSGTSSAMGLTLGVERIVDSLVNRYLGGAAGAAVRTLRDVSYYSAQAGGVGRTSNGIFGLSGTALGVLGGTGALVAAGAALTGIAVKGGNLAVELTKLSEKTGLTVGEVVKLQSASDALDADFDKVTIGFKKFSTELTLASTADLPGATKSAKEASALFKALGVDVKLAAQDPFKSIQQLSKSLSALPDGFVKTAAASALFGRGGIELIPVFDKLSPAMAATSRSSQDLINALGKNGIVKSAEDLRAQLVNFRVETEALEISLSQKLLPAIVTIVNFLNNNAKYLGYIINPAGSGMSIGRQIAEALGFKGPATGGRVSPDFSVAESFFKSGDTAKNLQAVASALGKVGDESDKSARRIKNLYDSLARLGTRERPGEAQQRYDDELYRIIGPSFGISRPGPIAPSIGNINSLPSPGGLLGLAGSSAQNSDILANLKSVNEEYLKQTQSETDKIKAEYDAQLDYWKFVQNQYPAYAKQAAQAITEIQTEENKKLADLQDKAFEKYKNQADSLFNDLISGKTKSFTKQLEKDIEDIVTKPLRDQFDKIFGGILQSLDQAINGKGSSAGKASGTSSTGAPAAASGNGGFLGQLFSKLGLGPGGTAGYFPGKIGIGGTSSTSSSGSVAIQTGQTGVSTPTMYVQAQVVNISGGGTGTSGGLGIPGASGASNFFGNNNPFSGSFGFFGNNSPVGSPSGSSSSGGPLGLLSQIAGPLLLGGLSARSGNTSGIAISAGSVAGSLAKLIPGAVGKSLGGILPGAGLVASGISQGDVGGALEDIGGGAQIGTAIAPGIGTIVGAAIGGLVGLFNGIFGGGGWQSNVQKAMNRQAIYLPPSENFSFASNGSISSTLGTGFSTSGNNLSQYGLGNTPFYASAIYGPLTAAQKLQLQQTELGLNSTSPFLGGSNSPDPFLGQNIPGYKPYPTSPPPYVGNTPLGYLPGRSGSNVQVHLNLPGYIDGQGAQAALGPHVSWIAQKVALEVNKSSSGFGNNVRRAAYLP
jgi:hypothetical protein